jgi:hypothetical protein
VILNAMHKGERSGVVDYSTKHMRPHLSAKCNYQSVQKRSVVAEPIHFFHKHIFSHNHIGTHNYVFINVHQLVITITTSIYASGFHSGTMELTIF